MKDRADKSGAAPETLALNELVGARSVSGERGALDGPDTLPLEATRPLPDAVPVDPLRRRRRPLRWLFGLGLGLLVSGLLVMAAERLVAAAALEGHWYGWLGLAGLSLLLVGCLAWSAREGVGLARLRSLARLQAQATQSLLAPDRPGGADRAVAALERHFAGRGDLEWALAAFREERQPQQDAGDLLGLFEIQVLKSLDARAEIAIAEAARRAAVITAISPFALLDMAASLVVNLSLLRRIAGLYGGRPGWLGSLRLLRNCLFNVLASGAIDLGDDTLGDLIGAGLAGRLSRRAGTGVLNGLLTARLGLAAVDLCRPLPWRRVRRPSARALAGRALSGVLR